MPKAYGRTSKGMADYWIMENAHDWVSVDDVLAHIDYSNQSVLNARRSVLNAMDELAINNRVDMEGKGKEKRVRVKEWVWKMRQERRSQHHEPA